MDFGGDLISIAGIKSERGVKGEFTAVPLTSSPEYYAKIEEIYLETENGHVLKKVRGLRFHKGCFLFKLEGIDTPEEAAALKRRHLKLPRKQLRPLDDDEFFIHEFKGCEVFDLSGTFMGTVKDYFESGGGGIAEVSSPRNSFLFPISGDILVEFDASSQKVVIDPPEGLIELNRKSGKRVQEKKKK